jgi:hypothetical protein
VTKRRQDIEFIRIVGAFGIVWCHTFRPFVFVAYSGLIVFLVLSANFAANPARSDLPLASRARRILVPWVVWFAVYGAFNLWRGLPFFAVEGIVPGILTGTSIHLWYMPFIFVATAWLGWMKGKMTAGRAATLYSILGLTFLGTAFLWRGPSLSWPLPWPQYMHAASAVLFGAFMANRNGLSKKIFGLLLFAFAALSAALLPLEGMGLPYLLGILVTTPVLLSKRDLLPGANLIWLSECMLGVYLSHFFWWVVILKIGDVRGFALPIAIFFASALSVFLFRRFFPRVANWVV